MNDGMEFVTLDTEDADVIGMKVTGKVTAAAITALVTRLERIRASGSKARLYLDLRHYEGYELPVVREKLAHLSTFWSSIERCAYVVDKGWMATAVGLVDAVTPMHLRAFQADEDAEARRWIVAKM